MEVFLVLFLLSLVMLLVMPSFQSMIQGGLQREVNRLIGVMRLVRNEAVLTHTAFQLVWELEEASYQVEAADDDGQFVARQDPPELRRHQWPKDFKIRDMVMFGRTVRTEPEVRVAIRIDPSGFMDPFLLHLRRGETDYTLRVAGFTGRLELLEGYVED